MLDQFTSAYIDCALFTSTDDNEDPLEDNYSLSDLAPETLSKIITDCHAFIIANIDDIESIPDFHGNADSHGRSSYTNYECAGHDFWFTRNGHGVGFWCREELEAEVKARLTKASKAFGECTLYVGDDGLLYLS